MAYDLIAIGGGLAGASLAKVMAERGARVLVLERETAFRDRVRGEGMHPWGVAEARALGIYRPLVEQCGHEVRWWDSYGDDQSVQRRDLVVSSPHDAGSLTFHHPEMQEVLLEAAAAAGADVRRGVAVVGVASGAPPTVMASDGGGIQTLQARLVVGADGRSSSVRRWAGFRVERDPDAQMVASVLMRDLELAEDAVHWKYDPVGTRGIIIFPLGGRRFRIYFMYRAAGERRRLSGAGQVAHFVAACVAAGTPEAWFARAQAIGPLAEYNGAARWVDHPYRDGVVLVGDAAAAPDPSWGCGLSLALRDVRVLHERLAANGDWEAAARSYAHRHDRYFGALHRIEGWHSALLYDQGEEARARRARAFSQGRTDLPDIIGLGPDSPADEAARRRLFGEE